MPEIERDKRKISRMRTRLRSGKVASLKNHFLSDCLVHDRSGRGVRIRLARPMRLPDIVAFFDDELEKVFIARVVWQKGNLAGLLFADGGPHAARGLGRMLKGKYYAINAAG